MELEPSKNENEACKEISIGPIQTDDEHELESDQINSTKEDFKLNGRFIYCNMGHVELKLDSDVSSKESEVKNVDTLTIEIDSKDFLFQVAGSYSELGVFDNCFWKGCKWY